MAGATKQKRNANIHRCDWNRDLDFWTGLGEFECIAEDDGNYFTDTSTLCAVCTAVVHPECYEAALCKITGGKINYIPNGMCYCFQHCPRLKEREKQAKIKMERLNSECKSKGNITLSGDEDSEEEEDEDDRKPAAASCDSSSSSSDSSGDLEMFDVVKKGTKQSGNKKSDDDPHYDGDDNNADNNGLGYARARGMTRKKQSSKKSNITGDNFGDFANIDTFEGGSESDNDSDSDGDTPETGGGLAEPAAAVPPPSPLSNEDIANAFSQKNFQVGGESLDKDAKFKIVSDFVCLFTHLDAEGENSMDRSALIEIFDGWFRPEWWEIAFDVWEQLWDMLDKKTKTKFPKSGLNVKGRFAELACQLGCMLHTQQCEQVPCDLCAPNLPPPPSRATRSRDMVRKLSSFC